MKGFQTLGKNTIFIFSYDYAIFLQACLESCKRELSDEFIWVVLETGRTEATRQIVSEFEINNQISIDYRRLAPDTSTLRVLSQLGNTYESEYAVLISADDALGEGYGNALKAELRLSHSKPTVVNFSQTVCNELLQPIDTRKSNWSDHASTNRLRLSFGNPGTTAGVLLPWNQIYPIFLGLEVPDILIEDYWLWWQLIDFASFKNNLDGKVLYRKHSGSISKSTKNSRYAYSLGYSSALPINLNNRIDYKLIALFLIPRWGRRIHFTVWKFYVKGYLACLRETKK